MRLRTFESFFLLKNGLLYSYPMLRKNISTEIVVVGGGITGALISHALVEEGYKVTVIDRRDIGQGSTSATTSMLQYEIDTPMFKLAEMIGEDGAALCYEQGIDAIYSLRELVDKYKIDCGFEMKQSLHVAHNKISQAVLAKEFEMRDKYQLGVKWLTAAEIKKEYAIHCFGGILSKVAASVDAYKLAHELIAMNVQRGMQVFDQTEVIRFNTSGSKPEIVTETGSTIKCKKIVFCNGFESTLMLKEKVAELFYTYAIVSEQTEKMPECLNNTLVWDTQDPYLYIRSTGDGRMLVGGEDDPFDDSLNQQEIKEKKSLDLQKKLKQILPKSDFVEDFSWGGVFGSTKDGLPYIGASPEFRNSYFVLGFGGNGITFSVQGMKLITELLKGGRNELCYYYRFGR